MAQDPSSEADLFKNIPCRSWNLKVDCLCFTMPADGFVLSQLNTVHVDTHYLFKIHLQTSFYTQK
jgi:hypothetical protein